LAGGEDAFKRINGIGSSEDIEATVNGMRKIVSAINGTDEAKIIDANESGSTLRFLLPIAAAIGGNWRFQCRGRLIDRPLNVFEELFVEHGAAVGRVIDESGKKDIRTGNKLLSGTYELSGDVSSQFISGLMFALPLLEGDSEIKLTSPLESAPYVDMTIDTLAKYGVQIEAVSANSRSDEIADQVRNDSSVQIEAASANCGNAKQKTVGSAPSWAIKGLQKYKAADFVVERDWSQAAVFFCAKALGCDVEVSGMNLDSKQGDRKIVEFLEKLGSEIDVKNTPDIVPPLAATACFADGETRIINAGRLRLKESDRLSALTEELGKIGADIRIERDSLVIKGTGGRSIKGGAASSHEDHRIAMALAVASIKCERPVVLSGEVCVNKSYPDFWRDFEGDKK
jgi:3-phosphoshikimate 1-carboxyvinyltransferase